MGGNGQDIPEISVIMLRDRGHLDLLEALPQLWHHPSRIFMWGHWERNFIDPCTLGIPAHLVAHLRPRVREPEFLAVVHTHLAQRRTATGETQDMPLIKRPIRISPRDQFTSS